MTTLDDTSQLRQLLDDILTLFAAALVKAWRPLDFSDRDAVMTAMREAVPDLLDQYGGASAAVAADWYAQVRREAGVKGDFTPDVVPPDMDAIAKRIGTNVGWATKPLGEVETSSASAPLESGGQARQASRVTRSKTIADLSELSDESLARLIDQSQLDLAVPARDTILQGTLKDPGHPRYARVPRSDCCAFCALLASRGAVYYEMTVGFESHPKCRCVPAPSWKDAPYEPPADLVRWQAAYREASKSGRSLKKDILPGMRKLLGVR